LQVKQKKDGIFINQDMYVAEILKKFRSSKGKSASTPINVEKPLLKDSDGEDVNVHTYRLTKRKLASTPIDTEKPLLKDPDGEDIDVHTYRSMIGSLMYLTSSRPDIMFAVCACARFQVTPKASHLHAVKRIFRYLKGKPHLGLWYPKDSPFDLVTYSDSDYAGASLDRKSTTERCEGFNQVIDFLNGSYLKYALTVNPNIYVSCIKQFWNTVAIKQVNDVTRLQALVDKKKVVVTEAAIKEVLHLDDAEGVDCLPNEEIFTELARMGYEKPSTMLTFYKAFFSSQWKVGKGFYRVETPLFEGMLIGQDIEEEGDKDEHVDDVTTATPPPPPPQDLPSTSQVQHTLPQSPQSIDTSNDTVMDDESNQGMIIDEMDKDDAVVLMDEKKEDKKEDEPAEVHKVVDVVTTAKLITEVVTAASETVTAASAIIPAAEPQVHAAIITAALAKVAATPSKKGVVIRDPKEESTTSTSSIIPETKSKDKGKGILVEEPKPLKKKKQIEMDEEYARKLHVELNKDIDWDVAIYHVKLKAKEDPAVKRYQAMKRKPKTEAQARKNMKMYLKNVAGFKLDYFRGCPMMTYIEEEESRALQKINKTLAEKAAKRRKLNEEVEELKRHLEIVPDEDDDVYTEATPLARKVPVVDYNIIEINNKPYYKIIRADGTHQLYISFLTLLKNFDREDLEALWNLVKERFSTANPNNFSNDFLLTTLGAMFEKPDALAQV
nr:hypothetical protein [Tanacetum cinerariifolium]